MLGLIGLLLLEGRRTEIAQPFTPPAAAEPPTRLVVFWIDSLSMVDPERPGMLTRLRARMEKQPNLSGPVRACADAVSVPCFTALITGRDGFSAFSLARNFGGLDQGTDGSVIDALRKTGKRFGYLGDPIFRGLARGFDYVVLEHEMHDVDYVQRGLVALESEKLDAIIIHLRESDKLSHMQGPASPEYIAAMEAADVAIDAAVEKLRPTDHWVVLGDHGHEPDGRHFAGLDVPTWTAYFGPKFTRTLKHPMAITDHANLWASVFGSRFGPPGTWMDTYFAGGELTPPEELPEVQSGAPLPMTNAAAVLLVALLVAAGPGTTRLIRRPSWIALAGLAGLVTLTLLLGAAWVELRPNLGWRPRSFNIGAGIAAGLIGAVLLYPVAARATEGTPAQVDGVRAHFPGLFIAGALMLVAPTVYKYGGVAAALATLLVVFGVGVIPALRARAYGSLIASLLTVFMIFTVWNPAVRNFAVRWFSFYSETLGEHSGLAALAFAALATGVAAGRERPRAWWIGGGVGLLVAALAGLHVLPARALILPCVGALPATIIALRRPAWGPVALACALPALAFFFAFDGSRLGPIAAALAAFALWPLARRNAGLLELAATQVLMVWLAFWVTLGCRASGLDFQYFFAWLSPGADPKDTWAANALMTISKYLILPVLGIVLARRRAGDALIQAAPISYALARGRLALVLVFLAAFSVQGAAAAGPFVTADVVQEAILWLLGLLALLCVMLNRPGGGGAGARTQPEALGL